MPATRFLLGRFLADAGTIHGSKHRTSPAIQERMNSILAVTAHPDDESFILGGTLAVCGRRGWKAGLFCMTDGQAGRTGGLVERAGLGPWRRAELEQACAVLGIEHLMMPGYMDGALEELGDERGTACVRDAIEDFGADVVLTFGPEGASGHPDHRCVWRWSRAAAAGRHLYAATFRDGMEVPGGPPLPVTTVVDISELGDAKRRAFLEHRSQVDHLELLDRILHDFDSKEYYHRVFPPWKDGDPLETNMPGA